MQKSKGFTLIELLIVVAIIAILAAIAVPNFLEAQVRAKVARVKSDQRTLATAVESYFVDHGSYPPNHNGPAQQTQGAAAGLNPRSFITMTVLSTPISYISNALLPDPFPSQFSVVGSGGDIYTYTNAEKSDSLASAVIQEILVNGVAVTGPAQVYAGLGGSAYFGDLTQAQGDQLFSLGWALYSQGPDRISRLQEIERDDLSGDPKNVSPGAFVQWLSETASTAPAIYDPTNGTVSNGDILRTGKGVFEPRHVGL
jgi:prepilin-type N-terminal cleavage/methylation domain-containing protein